ncbi:MAG TPA: thioredoxin family protein [Methanothrix sp.]|nr:thioredoxin family protein [Methanothrix sp.]HPJ84204.1 thioredoxin family protein [Methanothrix sp.]HPR66104.1 thioredoxin family protein [Methanothrix sp.]
MRSKLLLALAILGTSLILSSTSMAVNVPVGLDSPYVVTLDFSGQNLVIDPKTTTENDGYLAHSTYLLDPDSGVDGCYISVYNFSAPISTRGLAPALKASMEVNCVGVKVEPQNGGTVGTGVFAKGAWISWGLIVPIEAEGEGVESFGMMVAYFRDETLNERLVKLAKFGLKSEELPELPRAPIIMTEESIGSEIARYPIVIVDFWSTRCSHCSQLAPIFDELAEEFQGKAVFGNVNMNENPSMWDEYEIGAVPTMIVFKNGTAAGRIVGAFPKPTLKSKIQGYL